MLHSKLSHNTKIFLSRQSAATLAGMGLKQFERAAKRIGLESRVFGNRRIFIADRVRECTTALWDSIGTPGAGKKGPRLPYKRTKRY